MNRLHGRRFLHTVLGSFIRLLPRIREGVPRSRCCAERFHSGIKSIQHGLIAGLRLAALHDPRNSPPAHLDHICERELRFALCRRRCLEEAGGDEGAHRGRGRCIHLQPELHHDLTHIGFIERADLLCDGGKALHHCETEVPVAHRTVKFDQLVFRALHRRNNFIKDLSELFLPNDIHYILLTWTAQKTENGTAHQSVL